MMKNSFLLLTDGANNQNILSKVVSLFYWCDWFLLRPVWKIGKISWTQLVSHRLWLMSVRSTRLVPEYFVPMNITPRWLLWVDRNWHIMKKQSLWDDWEWAYAHNWPANSSGWSQKTLPRELPLYRCAHRSKRCINTVVDLSIASINSKICWSWVEISSKRISTFVLGTCGKSMAGIKFEYQNDRSRCQRVVMRGWWQMSTRKDEHTCNCALNPHSNACVLILLRAHLSVSRMSEMKRNQLITSKRFWNHHTESELLATALI